MGFPQFLFLIIGCAELGRKVRGRQAASNKQATFWIIYLYYKYQQFTF
jgi:hypothetical protein